MKDIYVLKWKPGFGDGSLIVAADDFERASMEMARFPAIDQKAMEIVNIDLREDGDL